MNNLLQLFKSTSALNGANANFVEDMYEQYLNDPDSVDPQWQKEFNAIRSNAESIDIPHSSIKKHFADLAKVNTLMGRITDIGIEVIALECDDEDAAMLRPASVDKTPGKWSCPRENPDFSRHVQLRAGRWSGRNRIV